MPAVRFNRNEIRTLHTRGLSDYAIARSLGCSRPLVTRFRGAEGLIRNPQPRSYSVDHHFFRTIDSPTKAYWLGFILADGCIDFDRRRNPRALVVKLSAKDRGHLEKLAESIRFNGPIREKIEFTRGKRYRKTYIAVSSSELCRDLVDAGWWDFKANGDTRIFTKVPKEQLGNFMRGFFDGDGCFTQAKRGLRFVFVDMHEQPVLWYRNQLSHTLGLKLNKVCPSFHSRLYRFQYDGIQVKSIMRFLYAGGGPCLSRKRGLVMKANAT
jgi:hypothetical protein